MISNEAMGVLISTTMSGLVAEQQLVRDRIRAACPGTQEAIDETAASCALSVRQNALANLGVRLLGRGWMPTIDA